MNIIIESTDQNCLDEYSQISIRFEVKSILEVSFKNNGLNGIQISEKPIDKPYFKNYDEFESPQDWTNKWDTSKWGFFIARNNENKIIGGMTIAYDTENVLMLEGRKDMSVIWDIRIDSKYRRTGIGSILFQKAIEFSKERNCKTIKIETQNNNVQACQFYLKQDCYLGGIHPGVYNEFPSEIQLLWYKKISNEELP